MEDVEAKQRPNERYFLSRNSRRLERGLQDIGTADLPGVFTPEWPNFPPEAVDGIIDSQYADISRLSLKGEISEHTANILGSQVRAIDYLYGRREEAVASETAGNPLVDIITLIAAPSGFTLTAEGAPKPIRFLGSVDSKLKPEQYTYFNQSPSWRSEYRTISNFGRQLSTVIRGLYVLGEAAKHHPVIIPSTLNQYSEKVKGGSEAKVANTATAIGLLEILNNTNLLYDHRFRPLAEQLRDIVFEDVPDYSALKKRYPYTVIEKRAFWYDGEVHANGRRKNLKYVKSENSTRVEASKPLSFEFPQVSEWTQTSRNRMKMKRQIRGLTMAASVRRTAIDFDQEKTIEAVKEDRIKKADLAESVRSLERSETDRLTRGWRSFLTQEIDEGAEVTSQELSYLRDAVTLIAEYFLPDETLSQKTKTNIRQAKEGKAEYYDLDLKELADDPLFSWIFAIRNPYVAESLKASLENSPENSESFFLLLKLMTYKLARNSFDKKELDFLFDPHFRQKVDGQSILKLFNSIRILADKFVPDVREIVRATLAKRDTEIEDLLTEQRLQKTRKRLEELTYRRILRFIKWPKSRQFTEVDKKLALKVSKRIALATGGIAGLMLSISAGDAIFDIIAEAKELEQQKELQELARQGVAEELERQERQKEIERLKQLDEQARQNLQNRETLSQEKKEEEALELAASAASTPENIDDRIPDAIDRESLEGIGLATFGRIYHLPETMRGADGEYVGYFPWDINMQIFYDYTDYSLDRWYGGDESRNLDDYTVVDSIDNYTPAYKENQLAYALNGVNSVVYAPIGWRIVSVVQEGGKQPMIGAFGEIYYGYDNQDNFPQRVLMILEPTQVENLSPRMNKFSDIRLHEYWPSILYGVAEETNLALSDDPLLQEIHADFISEMKEAEVSLDNLYRQNRQLTNEDYAGYFEKTSQIAIKYASLYAQYTDSNRYYALSFAVDRGNGDYPSLKSIAQNPDAGYFCSTAAFAFRDFMNSAGFVVANQPGMPMVNYRDYLWGKMGHQNSVVFLPNGEILEVDMTPPVTSRTPIEDLQALAGRYVSPDDIEKAIEKLVNEQEQVSGEVVEEAPSNTTVNSYDDLEKTRALRLNPNYISSQERNEILEDMNEATSAMIADRLGSDFTNQANINNQERKEEINSLKSIENSVDRLSESAPSLENIVLGEVSAEQIEDSVDILDRIIQDSSILADSLDANLPSEQNEREELSQVASEAARLKQSYEAIAGNMLEQLRQDRAYIQSIEAELIRFRRYTKPQPKDNGNDIEKLRIEREMELRRQVEGQELYFIYDMRDVAKLKRDVVFDTVRLETDTDYSPAVADEATEVTAIGRIAEIFNDIGASLTSIVPRATELERHINNTPWITSRLTQEDKQKVASFSEVVADLRDTLDPASNLTPEQQLVRLSSQYSKLQEITDIVDRVLNDRINDRILDEREQQQEIARFKALSERSH